MEREFYHSDGRKNANSRVRQNISLSDRILGYQMDKLMHYSELIKKAIADYDNFACQAANKKHETCLVFDNTHNHYLWLTVDWEGSKRYKNTHVHIRIKNEKI